MLMIAFNLILAIVVVGIAADAHRELNLINKNIKSLSEEIMDLKEFLALKERGKTNVRVLRNFSGL